MFRTLSLYSAAALAAALASPAPAAALSMKECSAKYQAAKDANTLNGAKWNDFRKTECAADDAAPAASAPAPKPAATTTAAPSSGDGLTMKECSAKYQSAKSANTLNGMKWNDFRKSECATGDATAPAAPTPAPKPAATTTAAPSSGGGLTMKECSAKYQSAKSANSLNGMKWNDFRKAECSDDDASEADATAAEAAPPPASPKATPTAAPNKPVKAGSAAFPSEVSTTYANETPGKARMHTCLDQYRANKANNAQQPNWIMKGGGYYSQCNTKLKAGA